VEPCSYVSSLERVPVPEDLCASLHSLLNAHRDCMFPEEVRALIPHPPQPWIDIEEDTRFCLGDLAVVSSTVETSQLVVFELVPSNPQSQRRHAETYVVFANFLEGRWLLTWPVPLGPQLH